MLRLTLLLAAIAATLIGVGYLLHLNPDPVTVRFSPTYDWQGPLPLVLLSAFLTGAAVTFVISLIRASQTAVIGWRAERVARRQRRQQVRKEQGLSFSWLGELDKARTALAKALRDGPDDLSAFLMFAHTYLEEGDFGRARSVLEEGLDRRGPDPKLLLFLAEAQRGAGDTAAAIETLERARRADPASPRVLTALRDAYTSIGRWRDAGRVQEALLLVMHDPPARADSERTLVGMRYQSTLEIADSAARISELRALLRAHPGFEPAAVSLGDALLAADQPRQAERVWRRAVTRGARGGALERLERLLAGGPRARRLDLFTRRLLRRNPEDGTARLFRARQLIRAGQLDEAAAELGRIGPPWNGLAGYHGLLAELHVRRGAHDDAVRSFRHALAACALGVFRCQVCGAEAEEWRGYCEGCRSWDSYRSSYEVPAPGERSRAQTLPAPVMPAPPH
jgi:tetratricopeptide (TPR) repeat protein